jgi:phosphate transport system substrate-binding protein
MKIKIVYILSLFVLLCLCLLSANVLAEQLVIPGTGASTVILQELADAFNAENPGDEIVIPPSVSSTGGISLTETGEYVLGRVARHFNEAELDYGLKYLPFAKDMIVFAVGSKVGVEKLTSRQLADLYSGKITNWMAVGGNDALVRLFIRNPNDSAYAIIQQNLEPFKDIEFSRKAKVMYHDYDLVNAFNKYTTVIGWLSNSTLKIVDPSVKTVVIDNVAPTQQNVYDGKYGLAFEYALVHKEGRLDGLAKKFVKFVFSKKGSIILISAGLVPVNDPQY